MRSDKKIDQQGTPVDGDEILIRMLCSPLQYDKETQQVSIDAFEDQLDVFEMLSDLAELISDTMVVAPARL